MRSPTESQEHRDERIVDYIERRRMDVNGYRDSQENREFLHNIMGYDRLMARGGEPVPLKKCTDGKVSLTVREIYSGAKKRLQKKK